MDRSSAARREERRNDRRNTTPYSRTPVKNTPVRKSSSWNPLASLRTFLSGRRDDVSVSGSEDEEWARRPDEEDGDIGRRENLYSLAAAGGRSGPEFEERARTWREGRSQLRGSVAAGANWEGLGLAGLPSVPSMPSLAVPARSAHSVLSPPRPALRASASTAALRQFMETRGAHLEAGDADVLEVFAQGLRGDTPEPPQQHKFGGWSAGTPRRFVSSHLEAPPTPGSSRSVSLGASTSGGARQPRKITYLGPGMSSRRLQRSPKADRKPLFADLHFSRNGASAESGNGHGSARSSEPAPEVSAAASVAEAYNAKRKVPLHASTATRESPARKKRAGDDILRDLIDEELGPREPAKPALVLNPYEDLDPAPSGRFPAFRSSLRQSSSNLKVSQRGSASRGAAEKLVNVGTSSRKLTTLELISGYDSRRSPSRSPEPTVLNPGASLRASTVTAPPPKAVPKPVAAVPDLVPFKPLPVESLSTSTVKSTPAPKPKQTASAPSVLDILSKSTSAPAAPAFTPRHIPSIGLGLPATSPVATSAPAAAPTPAALAPALPAPTRRDPAAIFLSPKDSALSITKAALPFFTFDLPAGSPEPSEAVKEAARKASTESFSFSRPGSTSAVPPSAPKFADKPADKPAAPKATPAPAPAPTATKPAAPAVGAEWTCDLCMLKNPDSAKEKCTICEAPRPGAAPAKPTAPPAAPPSFAPPAGGFSFGGKTTFGSSSASTSTDKPATGGFGGFSFGATPSSSTPAPAGLPGPPSGGFTFGAKATPTTAPLLKPSGGAGEWDCDTCMLKNPDSAKEKCTICEAPRPGAAPAAAKPSSAGMPAPPVAGGFTFGATKVPAAAPLLKPSGGAGEWECNTCMLKNPDSAKEKCTICEAPRPGAKPVAAAPAPPATMPAPPAAGGFSFGKPATSASASTSAGGQWECDTCMLKNPDSAKDKCTICEAPRPGAAPAAPKAGAPVSMPAPPSGGFSFGKPASGSGLSFGSFASSSSSGSGFSIGKTTPPTDTSSTSVPATGAPSFKLSSTPATFSFPKPGPGEWTCTTCMIQNKATATEQCAACETPRADSDVKPPPAPKPMSLPTPPAGGFSFGLKPAASSSTSASTSTFTPASGFSGFAPTVPSGGFSFGGATAFGKPADSSSLTNGAKGPSFGAPPAGGFTFGAAKPAQTAGTAPLLKPSGGAGEWTCDTCMLKNPDSAKEQCTICEAPRP